MRKVMYFLAAGVSAAYMGVGCVGSDVPRNPMKRQAEQVTQVAPVQSAKPADPAPLARVDGEEGRAQREPARARRGPAPRLSLEKIAGVVDTLDANGILARTDGIAYVSSGAQNWSSAVEQSNRPQEARKPTLLLRYRPSSEDSDIDRQSRHAALVFSELARQYQGKFNFAAYPEYGSEEGLKQGAGLWHLSDEGICASPAFLLYRGGDLPNLWVGELSSLKNAQERLDDLSERLHR